MALHGLLHGGKQSAEAQSGDAWRRRGGIAECGFIGEKRDF